ncbi:uncharacterized protein M6B38_256790 [Iris pallida]|uniref:DUF4378 domain-containing protein n=1 Tax=Iris pallida TaxID=29817 RepID=A0AAX6IFW1_IRIPA|nr:uncharacterized protein M6B38_391525 [Iris pallida]KAJ6852146.1 uncharacterized protein M6B38_256790 [Iris pallida]
MGGTKLITEKAHRDGSPSRRNRPEIVKKATNDLVRSGDISKTNELRKSCSSKKVGGTPMKMLIAEEMSMETAPKRKTSNVVARLMGLDEALPSPPRAKGRASLDRPSCVTLAAVLHDGRKQEDGSFYMPMPRGIRSSANGEDGYRDVYEGWKQPPRARRIKDQYLHDGRYGENQLERRMALVRQKFMEAKQLATNEKLLQSKQFEDALEVLNTNRDLFLKFLEEPNSLFSRHLKELHSSPPPPPTKRITVLKPSRTPMTKGRSIQEKKQQHQTCTNDGLELDKPQWSSSMTQPTRIVVLKPTIARHHEYHTKPMVAPYTSSAELMEKAGLYPDPENCESKRSRELAKEISHQMRENLGSHRRDESLLSSVLSNGYVGDESSFNRSENEYLEEGARFSDSEIVTPSSRHSWDYANRYESPYSLVSFSRASSSPEPSVIREAKKRLSERCALVASNGFGREQMEVRSSSSTLGEMLALNEIKEEEVEVGSFAVSSNTSRGGGEVSRVSTDSLPTWKDGDGGETSTWSLSRSKSVPVSSSAYENIGSNTETSDSQVKKPIVPKEAAKSGKSSFKGKVSRLFFSRNKKSGKEKIVHAPLVVSDDRIPSDSTESEDALKTSHNSHPADSHVTKSEEESVEASTLLKDGPELCTISFGAALFVTKPSTPEFLSNHDSSPSTSGKISQNREQPSPTSVLDAPFEDDSSTSNSCETSGTGHPPAPIEEVARSLSWNDTQLELSTPSSSQLSYTTPKVDEEENQWHSFVQSLLSAAALDNEKLSTVFTKFYSVDSPLDPNLLDKFLDRKEEESKSRERRSNLRLLFDCVNSALLDIDQTAYLGAYPWPGACNVVRKKALDGVPVGREVWMLVRDRFCGEEKLEADDNTDNSGIVVDTEVRRDICGRGWAELMSLEVDGIGRDISGDLFEDLVGEALADFSIVCLL